MVRSSHGAVKEVTGDNLIREAGGRPRRRSEGRRQAGGAAERTSVSFLPTAPLLLCIQRLRD